LAKEAVTMPAEVKRQLDHEPAVYLSHAPVWEITIEQSAGKLTEAHGAPAA
jgi:PIN domain nuclease of toxin-antitoxin system